MKEATGELNMTVVTVVAIAAVGAFFYLVIWPSIRGNLLAQTHCASAVNCDCSKGINQCDCDYYQDDGVMTTGRPIRCDRSGDNNKSDKTTKTTK